MSEHVVLVTGALTGSDGRRPPLSRATGRQSLSPGATTRKARRWPPSCGRWAAKPNTSGPTSASRTTSRPWSTTPSAFGQLDAAVNNAAHTDQFGRLVTQTAEAYDAMFNTNVRGLFFCLKHELRVMIEQGQGSIVNLSSTFGERGGAGAGLVRASKHAVNGLTRSAALEVAAKGIRVNAVAPARWPPVGSTASPAGEQRRRHAASVPMGRLGQVDEIADVITFLSSHAARFITGQIIAVNGGKTAL